MGNPISPDDPEWESCPDCILSIPDLLSAKVNRAPWGDFFGNIIRNPVAPSSYSGTLTHGVDQGLLTLLFCQDAAGKAQLAFRDPNAVWHRVDVPVNNCYPIFEITSADGTYFEVEP